MIIYLNHFLLSNYTHPTKINKFTSHTTTFNYNLFKRKFKQNIHCQIFFLFKKKKNLSREIKKSQRGGQRAETQLIVTC